jgi:hypothetical protein
MGTSFSNSSNHPSLSSPGNDKKKNAEAINLSGMHWPKIDQATGVGPKDWGLNRLKCTLPLLERKGGHS